MRLGNLHFSECLGLSLWPGRLEKHCNNPENKSLEPALENNSRNGKEGIQRDTLKITMNIDYDVIFLCILLWYHYLKYISSPLQMHYKFPMNSLSLKNILLLSFKRGNSFNFFRNLL